jgi:hypothetical protein
MKIPLDFWLTLEFLQGCARKFVDQAKDILVTEITDNKHQLNSSEVDTLFRQLSKLEDINWPDVLCQQEWTGGDSSDPRNFTVREPNCVGIAHTFPRDQVSKYRDEEGDLTFPQRNIGGVYVISGSTYWGEEGGTSKWGVAAYLFEPDADLHLERLNAYIAKEKLDKSLYAQSRHISGPSRHSWQAEEKKRRQALRTQLDLGMWQHMNVAETVHYVVDWYPVSFFGGVPEE